MKKKSKTSDFRERIVAEFLDAINKDPLHWTKKWSLVGTGRPYNGANGKPYNGANLFWLKMVEEANGFKDPRWMTFNQIKSAGYKVKAGSHGYKVEYWMPYDFEQKKCISWPEYNKITLNGQLKLTYADDNGKEQPRFSITAKYYSVFNGSQIEGLEPYVIKEVSNPIKPSLIVREVSVGMSVHIHEDKDSDRAYYSPTNDEICLPNKERFDSDYAYQATAMHELGHATGHHTRLNRNQTGSFGSSDYAYEELVAETASAFMSEYFNTELPESELKNHAAYIQSWASAIKDNKNYLFKAISDAEAAADYMINAGDLEKFKNIKYEKVRTKDLTVEDALNKALVSFTEYWSADNAKDNFYVMPDGSVKYESKGTDNGQRFHNEERYDSLIECFESKLMTHYTCPEDIPKVFEMFGEANIKAIGRENEWAKHVMTVKVKNIDKMPQIQDLEFVEGATAKDVARGIEQGMSR